MDRKIRLRGGLQQQAHETDGVFGYRLFALEEAELTNEVVFLSRILVPLPPPVLLCGVGLLVMARLFIESRRTQRTQRNN